MSNLIEKEIQNILDELNTVRPELLNTEAKRLFEAIMKIADEREEHKKALIKRIKYCNELKKDLFENCINYIVNKDKIREIYNNNEPVTITERVEFYQRELRKI